MSKNDLHTYFAYRTSAIPINSRFQSTHALLLQSTRSLNQKTEMVTLESTKYRSAARLTFVYVADDATSTPMATASFLANLIFIPND